MGYRIRILGTKIISIPLSELRELAQPALLEADEGTDDNWDALNLKHPDNVPIAYIEKNLVIPGELGSEELKEFIEEVSHFKPASAAAWLQSYLLGVKVIYAFQLLFGTDVSDGFEIMHRVYAAVHRHVGGILHADQEGFSNESGRTILWQFYDHVTGPWEMAVLDQNGNWINFEMDLGNLDHRESFLRGEVPAGVRLLNS